MTSIRLAGCVLTDNEGKILLLHRQQPGKEQWETPGGKVEPGESDAAAAIRELKEEIGTTVTLGPIIGEGDFSEGDNSFHYVWFHAALPSNINLVLEPRFTEWNYFKLSELVKSPLPLSAGTRRFLELFGN